MKTYQKTVLAALLCATSGSSFALDYAKFENGYVGASIGITDYGESHYDDEATSYSLLIGYKFTRYFATELSYSDFGEADAKGSGSGDLEADGFALQAVANLPLGETFSLYAKAGGLFWDASSSETGDHDSADWIYGLGVGYNVTPDSAVRLEYLVNELYHSVDVKNISLGLVYYF